MRDTRSGRLALVGALALLSLTGCDDGATDCPGNLRPERHEDRVSISQGLWGDVWFWEGDFMPVCPDGRVDGVSREVVIFAPASPDDVTEAAAASQFYTDVRTAEIARTTSDAQGFFQLTLPAGDYSVFVIEQGMYYGVGYGDQMQVSPARVVAGAVTELRADITYLSSW